MPQTRRPAPTLVTTTIPIQGMTCRACETRITKTLKQLPGVTNVKASTRLSHAEVTSTKPLDAAAVRRLVEQAGYTVGSERRPWLTRDRDVWRDVIIGAAVVTLAAIAAQAFGLGSIGDLLTPQSGAGLAVFALLGVAASFSTCLALVGGIVLGLSARFAATHPDATVAQRVRPQLMFNLGRVVGFSLLGALLGGLGRALSLHGAGLGLLTLAVAVVMVLLGLQLTGLSPRLGALTVTLPAAWSRRLHGAGQAPRPYGDGRAAALGVASFLLPCGFTQAAQVAAAASGSPVRGALILGLFTLGTTPGLLAVGTLSSLAGGRWARRVFHGIGVVVLAFALLNAVNGAHLVAPGLGADQAPITATARTANVTDQDGYQVVTITVDNSGYNPNETVVYAGRPIRWEFELKGLTCAQTVDGRNLNLGQLPLQLGVNTFESTLATPGRYPYTCYMGMFPATVIAIEAPA
ncbi:MAG: sulfite exporter TauE/SafE family protein [Propionibacteriaceae bacterium]|nr:sulfite exporter TauE/SafE family protein [Propionibacteriaceae bacterium]